MFVSISGFFVCSIFMVIEFIVLIEFIGDRAVLEALLYKKSVVIADTKYFRGHSTHSVNNFVLVNSITKYGYYRICWFIGLCSLIALCLYSINKILIKSTNINLIHATFRLIQTKSHWKWNKNRHYTACIIDKFTLPCVLFPFHQSTKTSEQKMNKIIMMLMLTGMCNLEFLVIQ